MKLATAERKTHWSDMDTSGYNVMDFTLHDNHVLNANVFMRPLVLLYNLYSGARVTIIIIILCTLRTCYQE